MRFDSSMHVKRFAVRKSGSYGLTRTPYYMKTSTPRVSLTVSEQLARIELALIVRRKRKLLLLPRTAPAIRGGLAGTLSR